MGVRAAVVVLAGVMACGAQEGTRSASTSVAFDPDSGQPIKESQVALELCDGSDALRLSYHSNGGASLPAHYVPSSSFFMLDGKCRLYAAEDPWQPLRVSRLSEQAVAELEDALDIRAWPSLAGSYFSGIPDGPTEYLWIYTQDPRAAPVLDGSDSPRALDLRQRARAFLMSAAQRGDETEGAVRYTLALTLDTDDILGTRAGAVPWPLGDSTAHVTAQGQTRIARDADAAALRALRARYLRGELGSVSARFIPILDTDNRRYELRMRDVAPYRDDSLSDVATPSCTPEVVYEAHERALSQASSAGCNVDADCVLSTHFPRCIGLCSVALPSAALADFTRLQNATVFPLCSARQAAGCQLPPWPACAVVTAVCREHACAAVGAGE